VEKSSLSRVLDLLERRGLVERRRDAGDARRKVLVTTPEAEAMKQSALAVALATQNAAVKGITELELAAALEVLKKVKANIRDGSL
jgi:MarR family transcriptional regulator for hemolysin